MPGLLRCVLPRVGLAVAGLLCLTAPPGAHAQSAGKWDKRGQNAEARQDYDTAFEDYRQAHLKKPADLRYRERFERLRYQAAALHVDRGRVLRQSGDFPGAINEFARALQIDPGNQAAAQELQITQQPRVGGGPEAVVATPAGGTPGQASDAIASSSAPGTVLIPGVDEQTPHQAQVKREIESLSGPVELRPVSTDPITLHMVEDTKVIYQAIGKAAGLNTIFDPEYSGKRIQVDLTNVSLWDALRIVGTLSGTFWKPVTVNTLFVAQNNRTKRTDLSDLVLQTFYLTNVAQQQDANEVLVALRNLLEPSSKLFLVTSQNAIVVRATIDELRLAEKVINDLDRQRAEVVVDVAVLEVSRQKERNLGITLPQSFGLTPTTGTTNSSTTTTSTATSTGTTGSATTSSNLTLNTLGNLNATNFAVTVTGGTVNALLSDSDTRILQNPRVRATDGQRATLKIGSKIPVATGSYSAGAALSSASLGVQTQFQYLDVGVNIDITPTVHYNREISLKLKVEISSENGTSVISGVSEPIIAQKVAEQVIELKDGEPSLLAGLLQQQESNTTSGTPFLAEIPFLKYFFSSNDKVRQKDEIVFLLIPHIVRESILTDENTAQIYTGTGQAIELLRRDPKTMAAARKDAALNGTTAGMALPAPKTSAALAANAAMGQLAQQAAPPLPPAPGLPAAGQQPVTLNLTPATADQSVGSVFQVALTVANALDLASVPVQLQFNPKVLSLEKVVAGPMLSQGQQTVALAQTSVGDGAVTINAARSPNAPGVNGQGTVVTMTFKAMAAGDSTLALVHAGAKNSQGVDLPSVATQAVVHVK